MGRSTSTSFGRAISARGIRKWTAGQRGQRWSKMKRYRKLLACGLEKRRTEREQVQVVSEGTDDEVRVLEASS